MPNGYGLVALTSSWGSGKIVMDPTLCNRYYIFHNDATGEGDGQRRLYYSMVDMNLPGNGTVFNPKGDVSPSVKNIQISNNTVEGIEIVPSAKSHDYWILATSNTPSAVSVFKFNAAGASLVNSYPLLNQPSDIRAIRFCGANNKLSIASCNDFEDVLIMDFNTATGEITNQTVVPSFPARMNGRGYGVYDLGWSPDGSKLYFSKYCEGATGGKLYQYDFNTTSTRLIFDVHPTSNQYTAKGLKLGPDGKIYFIYKTPDGQVRFLNGCLYSDSTTVTFKSQFVFPLGNDTTACDSFLLKLNSNFSHILWSTGSQATSILVRRSGTYMVTVTNKEGCTASDTISVIINDPPVINLGGPYNYCENIPIHQVFKITGMKDIKWSTGSTQDSILVTTAGTYSVHVTDMKGCKANSQVTVATLPLPIPAFNTFDACVGTNNKFIDASTITSGKIDKRQWNFGDGTTNQVDSIAYHSYLTSGTFPVKLIVTSDGKCMDSVTHNLSVYDLPVVLFDYKIVCPGNRIELLNNSTSQNLISGWEWDFGDGTIDQQKNPAHTYALKGNYPVSLTAKTDKGCVASLTKGVDIPTALKADFTTKNNCEGKSVLFTDKSSFDNISNTTYFWDFGDGTSFSTEKSPQHVYNLQGTYLVKLILSTNSGCTDSISKKVKINPNPKAAFIATNASGCSPLVTNFIDQSTIQTGKIINWQWQLGVRNSTAQHPEQVYRNPSATVVKYNVRLVVSSDSGCSAELLKPDYINIYPSPTASFSLAPKIVSVSDAIVSFQNNSQRADSVLWDFGDNTQSTVFNTAPHQYTFPDTFIVKLIAYTRYGCTDTIVKEIIVQPEFTFYVPNSFSPNDDGMNDYFSGKGEEILEYEMIVFNRLGDIMFRTNDIHVPWNGSKNNNSEQAAQDVYIYTINIIDKNRKKHFYKGIVTLVR